MYMTHHLQSQKSHKYLKIWKMGIFFFFSLHFCFFYNINFLCFFMNLKIQQHKFEFILFFFLILTEPKTFSFGCFSVSFYYTYTRRRETIMIATILIIFFGCFFCWITENENKKGDRDRER